MLLLLKWKTSHPVLEVSHEEHALFAVCVPEDFRGDDPEQETCQKCLVTALNIASNKAHEADEEKKRVAQQFENILDQMKVLERKLEVLPSVIHKL